ncbi:MAG: purine-nucleoside phosphorylase [Bacteroidia bacterium]
MLEQIKQSADYIKAQSNNFAPLAGIILGTGLGGLVKEIEIEYSINYADIPNFPVSTVESHQGRLILGTLSGKKVVAMQGRFHYYEGYSLQQVVFPVQVMKHLGIQTLIVSNACGSVVPKIKAGDLMIISDHINLLPGNPLIGKNYPELGPRFPDMSQAYDKSLVKRGVEIAHKLGIEVHTGVYAAVSGPNLETHAEYKFLRIIGADVVGMSTVPEVIAARHMELPVFAMSVITDEGWVEVLEPVTLEMVIAAANKSEPKMTQIMKELVATL